MHRLVLLYSMIRKAAILRFEPLLDTPTQFARLPYVAVYLRLIAAALAPPA